MAELVRVMYTCYVKPVLGEKGQDLVEYALLLAIVVGIGWLIYSQKNLGTNIETIVTEANDLMRHAKTPLMNIH